MFKIMLSVFGLTMFLCASDGGQAGNCCGGEKKKGVTQRTPRINSTEKEDKNRGTPIVKETTPLIKREEEKDRKSPVLSRSKGTPSLNEIPHEEIDYEGLAIITPKNYKEGQDENGDKKISVLNLCDIVFIPNCILNQGKHKNGYVQFLLNGDTQPTNEEEFEECIQSIHSQILDKDSTEAGRNFAICFKETMTKIKFTEFWFGLGKNKGASIILIKREENGVFLKIFGSEEKSKEVKKKEKKKKKNKKSRKKKNKSSSSSSNSSSDDDSN